MAAPFSWRCFQPGLSFHFPWAVSLQANHAFPALPSFLTCQICIHTRQFITGEACEHSRRLLNRNFYLVSLRDITLIPDKWFHIFQEEGSRQKKVFPNLIKTSKPEVFSPVFTQHESFPLTLELDPFWVPSWQSWLTNIERLIIYWSCNLLVFIEPFRLEKHLRS